MSEAVENENEALINGIIEELGLRSNKPTINKFNGYAEKVGYDKEFWARPMKRAITNIIMNSLSTKLISEEIKSGDKITIDIDEEWNLLIKKD